jgi:hypothetical protein
MLSYFEDQISSATMTKSLAEYRHQLDRKLSREINRLSTYDATQMTIDVDRDKRERERKRKGREKMKTDNNQRLTWQMP